MTALKLIQAVQMEPILLLVLRGDILARFNDVPLPAVTPSQEELTRAQT